MTVEKNVKNLNMIHVADPWLPSRNQPIPSQVERTLARQPRQPRHLNCTSLPCWSFTFAAVNNGQNGASTPMKYHDICIYIYVYTHIYYIYITISHNILYELYITKPCWYMLCITGGHLFFCGMDHPRLELDVLRCVAAFCHASPRSMRW